MKRFDSIELLTAAVGRFFCFDHIRFTMFESLKGLKSQLFTNSPEAECCKRPAPQDAYAAWLAKLSTPNVFLTVNGDDAHNTISTIEHFSASLRSTTHKICIHYIFYLVNVSSFAISGSCPSSNFRAFVHTLMKIMALLFCMFG